MGPRSARLCEIAARQLSEKRTLQTQAVLSPGRHLMHKCIRHEAELGPGTDFTSRGSLYTVCKLSLQ